MKIFDKIWQARFDLQALAGREEYQKLYHYSLGQQLSHQATVFGILSRAGLNCDARMLDVGCGTGAYLREARSRQLADTGWGIDISYNMLQRAKRSDPLLKGYLIQGVTDFLPVPDERFDAVLSIGVLQTVDDCKKAVSELCRVTKPGGILILSTLRKHEIWELFFLPVLLIMFHSGDYPTLGENLEMIRNRDRLIWKRLPQGFPPKRYAFPEIEAMLHENGMKKVHCLFPGRLGRIPRLLNSFHMFVVARKP